MNIAVCRLTLVFNEILLYSLSFMHAYKAVINLNILALIQPVRVCDRVPFELQHLLNLSSPFELLVILVQPDLDY